MGGAGKTVEADETELTKSRKTKRVAPVASALTRTVLSLVERGGNIRSMILDHRSVMKLTSTSTSTRIAAS